MVQVAEVLNMSEYAKAVMKRIEEDKYICKKQAIEKVDLAYVDELLTPKEYRILTRMINLKEWKAKGAR